MRFHTFVILVFALGMAGCESPQESVWLDDIEQIPVSSESSNSDPSLYTDEPLNFEDYFEYVGETQLSDDFVFGDMAIPVVGPQGQILVLDQEKVGLFDSEGQLLSLISPEECYPGSEYRPRNGYFLPHGGFLIRTGAAQGFWFHADGSCSEILPHRPYLSLYALSADSSLFAAKMLRESWNLIRFGKTESIVDTLYSGVPPLMGFRMIEGGLVLGHDQDLLFAVTYSPFVYRFRNGHFEKLGYLPHYYHPIQEDLTRDEQQNISALISRMSQNARTTSLTAKLFQLDDELLVLRYMKVNLETGRKDRETGALHIMDFDGNPITKGPLFLGELNPFYFANGSMYLREYDQSGLDDAPLNPKIIEYRFVGR